MKRIMRDISTTFPACHVDIRESASIDAEQARISDIARPFHHRRNKPKDFDLYGCPVGLYDGYELQRLFAQDIAEHENSIDHMHIIFTNLLACTFSDDDWRYHARTVICGTPSIISVPGIVEAPAKPKEFYFNVAMGVDPKFAKESIAGRILDYGDSRITSAVSNYALQAIFFFLSNGEPFCDDINCRLFNAHWQEDLIRILKNPAFCQKHEEIADKFNLRFSEMKTE